MSERPPCKCHGSWPLHADDQAAALRKLGLENDRLESQNQALQERAEKAEAALQPALGFVSALQERAEKAEAERDAAKQLLDQKTYERVAAQIADRALSPTQETDPE
jgi:hypothetical protein